MENRGYQERTIVAVEAEWAQGALSVCLVAPTGSGKTYMGARLVAQKKTLWVAHRQELIHQAGAQLRAMFGQSEVGVIMAGSAPTPSARIQVASIQTLLARGFTADVQLIVLDECHHFMADVFRTLLDAYPNTPTLGLTATPERADGRPLGDIFSRLVVAASYSELLAGGYIVPVRVFRPPMYLGGDLAQDPVSAWLRYSENDQTFAFFPRVFLALSARHRLQAAGVPTDIVEAETEKSWRSDVIDLFRARNLRVLTTVFALTEGVDVPAARVILSARAFTHVSGMLQAHGRALRAAPGKRDAIIIDLTGATIRHGLPTADREYSLTGRAIKPLGGDAPEPHEVPEFSQDVLGIEMVMAAPGALPPDAPPPPPPPLLVRPATTRELARVKKIAEKHGKAAMLAAAKYYEGMGQ